MTTHELKIKQCFADAIVNGEKNFEIRYNDRGYQTGDEIRFHVIDNTTGEPVEEHFIHKLTYKITYIVSGWGLENGYVALSIKQV